MENIQTINKGFNQCFEKASTFEHAQITTDIDKETSELITITIPQEISFYLDNNKYLVNGSVGKGRATKTPWIAILDKEITTSTREGVYIVFLFSSDYKHVYLTLNQGTTVPGQFGPRIGKKEIAENSKRIRVLLNINDSVLKADNNADIADERYKLGAIYYTLWNVDDAKEGEQVLNLYLSVYEKYKNMTNTSQHTTNPPKKAMTLLPFSISNVIGSILSTGLIYSPTLIKHLAFSLMAKPFVILSGLAGSGKTQLVLAFAKCLSEKIKEQVCTVSIGADWTNREPLLGYPNALKENEYVLPESGVLQLLMRANEDPDKPYFLILDEMNLSVVERYFADFLSAMESRETGFVSFLDEKNAVKWTPPDNNGIVPYIKPICFTIPSNVISGHKIKAFQFDINGDRKEYDFQYITTIKQNYAQRIANHAFAYPIRVGVDFV